MECIKGRDAVVLTVLDNNMPQLLERYLNNTPAACIYQLTCSVSATVGLQQRCIGNAADRLLLAGVGICW